MIHEGIWNKRSGYGNPDRDLIALSIFVAPNGYTYIVTVPVDDREQDPSVRPMDHFET